MKSAIRKETFDTAIHTRRGASIPKNKMAYVLFLSFVISICPNWLFGFEYGAYKAGTLWETGLAECPSHFHVDEFDKMGGEVQFFASLEMKKLRARVVYTGEFRQITPMSPSQIITHTYLRSMGQAQLINLYHHEVQIKEDTRLFWLPVQEQVIPYMKAELQEGDSMDVFTIYTGCSCESKKPDQVTYHFIVTEFEKYRGVPD